jgi:hypothetical protein
MIREVIEEVNVKYGQQISSEFVLPRIAKGFVGDFAPSHFIVPCSCLAQKEQINEQGELHRSFYILEEETPKTVDSTAEAVHVPEPVVKVDSPVDPRAASHHDALLNDGDEFASVKAIEIREDFGSHKLRDNLSSKNAEDSDNDLDIRDALNERMTVMLTPEEERLYRLQ